MSTSEISLHDQRTVISANLHSTALLFFLIDMSSVITIHVACTYVATHETGVYSGVYPSSVYIYLRSQRASKFNKCVVVAAMTALYALLLIQLGVQWDYINIVFVEEGASRASIFTQSVLGSSFPVPLSVLQLILQNAGFLLADGLMVWRCFNACGRSAIKFAFPLILFIVEFELAVADTTFLGIYDVNTAFEVPKRAEQANTISATLFCSGAATTLVATFIICFQIYSRTTQNPRSRRRYRHIIDTVTQSCALYTICALLLPISDFLNTGEVISSINSLILTNYLSTAALMASGLAPTLMVARLTLSGAQDYASTSVSSAILPPDLEGQPIDGDALSTDMSPETNREKQIDQISTDKS